MLTTTLALPKEAPRPCTRCNVQPLRTATLRPCRPLDRLDRLLVSSSSSPSKSSSSSSKSSSLAKICRTVVCYQRIVIEITEHLRRMQYSLWRRRRRRRRALTSSSSSSSSSSLATDPTPPQMIKQQIQSPSSHLQTELPVLPASRCELERTSLTPQSRQGNETLIARKRRRMHPDILVALLSRGCWLRAVNARNIGRQSHKGNDTQ